MNRHNTIDALYKKALNGEQIKEEELIEAFTKICTSKGKDFAEYVVAHTMKELLNKTNTTENIASEFGMLDQLNKDSNETKDKVWAIRILEIIAIFVRIVRDY